MRKLIFVSLLFAAACSKKGDYEKACNHMIDLAYKDLDDNIAEIRKVDESMVKNLEDMKKQAEAKRGSDLATCISKSEEKKVDADCILKAGKLDDLKTCGIGGF